MIEQFAFVVTGYRNRQRRGKWDMRWETSGDKRVTGERQRRQEDRGDTAAAATRNRRTAAGMDHSG